MLRGGDCWHAAGGKFDEVVASDSKRPHVPGTLIVCMGGCEAAELFSVSTKSVIYVDNLGTWYGVERGIRAVVVCLSIST